MNTTSRKTAYNNKLAEMKEKYFPLLEKLIKTDKAEKFQAVYTALNNKRLTIECLLKFEAILEKVGNIGLKKQTAASIKYSDTGQRSEDISETDKDPLQADCLKHSPKTGGIVGGHEALQIAHNPLFSEEPDQPLQVPQVVDVEANSSSSQKVSTDLTTSAPKLESSCEAINTTTNANNTLCMTNKVHENNNFEESIKGQCLKSHKINARVQGQGLSALVSKANNKNYDKVGLMNEERKKANCEQSNTEKNELLSSSLRKQNKNDVEIVAAVAGTNSLQKLNQKESQYVDVKKINQSSYYCQVRKDKLMLNSQVASMKRGTVFDLVDKNNRYKGQSYTNSKSHNLPKSKDRCTIPTSDQCQKTTVKTFHGCDGTQKSSNDIDTLLSKRVGISNFVDKKMYDNLKSAVKILGLNTDVSQTPPTECNKNEYDSKLKNNAPPLLNKPISPLSKQCVPPLANGPAVPLLKPSTQNVQFSCNVTLPSSTNALVPNWYQNPYQNDPRLVPYQPIFCTNNSQSSLLPTPFPLYNVTQNPYIATQSIPVFNHEPDRSHCSHLVSRNSDPNCLSCYRSPYTYSQINNGQVHDITANNNQTTISSNTSEQSNNIFNTERYPSRNSGKHFNNYNNLKQNYRQRYRHEYTKPYNPDNCLKYDYVERRPRSERCRSEHKYFERQRTDDGLFVKDRRSLREKYSCPENIWRKNYDDEQISGRAQRYTDRNPKASCEEYRTLRTINDNNNVRPVQELRDQSKYCNTSKSGRRSEKGAIYHIDKESYISPLKNLYDSSCDTSFQSVKNHKLASKQYESAEVKRVFQNLGSKTSEANAKSETVDAYTKLSKLDQVDRNKCITQDTTNSNSEKTRMKKNGNSQNVLKSKCDKELHLTKKCNFDKTIKMSNKPHIAETVFNVESKLHNNVIEKHPILSKAQTNISETKNIKPFKTKEEMSDKETTRNSVFQKPCKEKFGNSNNTSNSMISGVEAGVDSDNADGKRMKYCKTSVTNKPRKKVKKCCKVQPNSLSIKCSRQTTFELENTNGCLTNEFQKRLSKNTCTLNRSASTSGVIKKKYVRKRVRVICSDSDSSSEIEETKAINHSSGVQKKKCFKVISSDSDCNHKKKYIKQSNCGSSDQKKKKLAKISLNNFILEPKKNRGKKIVLETAEELKIPEKNGTNKRNGPKKAVKFVNEAVNLNIKRKKSPVKLPTKKKTVSKSTLPQSAGKDHDGTNKPDNTHEQIESSNPNVTSLHNVVEETNNQIKVVYFSMAKCEQNKVCKEIANSLTDVCCKEMSKKQENHEKMCSPKGDIETPQNKVRSAEIVTDQTSASEDVTVNKTAKEFDADLSSTNRTLISDLFENMKDTLKPEAVQALLVSLVSNSGENQNLIKRLLENIVEEQKNKGEYQRKLKKESHVIDTSLTAIDNNTRIQYSNNVGQTKEANGSKIAVGRSENSINKNSNGSAKKGDEPVSTKVTSMGHQDRSTGCQDPDSLIEDCSSSSNNNDHSNHKKLANKQKKHSSGEFINVSLDEICHEQKTAARRKCSKKGTRELDSIHKALNSLPQYSDIMKSGGLRTCRMKTKCGSSLNENYNLKKQRKSVRTSKPIKAIDLSCNNPTINNNTVLPACNNSLREKVIEVANVGLEEEQSVEPTSINVSETTLMVKSNETNEVTHEDSYNIEIVNVFSMQDEARSIDFFKEEVIEENECVNIAKDVLADFEEDLTDKCQPSVIKHTETCFLGLDAVPSDLKNNQKNSCANANNSPKSQPVPVITSSYAPVKELTKMSKLTLQQYWKNPGIFAQMLTTCKLGHFYKCMHSDCVFTSDNEECFAFHLTQHSLSGELSSVSRDSWMLCAYCSEMLRSVPQYIAHLHYNHGESKNQCCYCFCRTPTIPEALAHQMEMHPDDPPHVLQCFLGGTTVDVYLVPH